MKGVTDAFPYYPLLTFHRIMASEDLAAIELRKQS